MKFSSLFFYFSLLHILVIYSSTQLSLENGDWIKVGFNDKHKMYVEKNNPIVRNLIKINCGVLDNLAGAFPVAINLNEWIVLNKCLETDTEKISKDQILDALYIANNLNLLEPQGSESTFIVDTLFSKAKKMLTFDDIKGIEIENKKWYDLCISLSRSRLNYQLASIKETKKIRKSINNYYGDDVNFIEKNLPVKNFFVFNFCFFIMSSMVLSTNLIRPHPVLEYLFQQGVFFAAYSFLGMFYEIPSSFYNEYKIKKIFNSVVKEKKKMNYKINISEKKLCTLLT